jgi:hypothetical protein
MLYMTFVFIEGLMHIAPSPQHRQRAAWILNAALSRIRRHADCESICRMSVAHYDWTSGMVTALAHAGEGDPLLDGYQQPLAAMPGLVLLAAGPGERIIHDIPRHGNDRAPHHTALRLAGIRSSLTMSIPGSRPTIDEVAGFLFVNSKTTGAFGGPALQRLSPLLGELTDHLRRELIRPAR